MTCEELLAVIFQFMCYPSSIRTLGDRLWKHDALKGGSSILHAAVHAVLIHVNSLSFH